MAGALQALAVALPTVAQFFPQQLADRVRADRMAQRTQAVRKLGMALGNPKQRPDRIAQRCRLDQSAQVRQERLIRLLNALAPAAGTTHLARRQSRPIQIRKPAPDRAPGDAGGPRSNDRIWFCWGIPGVATLGVTLSD